MTHLHLYSSNRLEILADRLAEVLRQPPVVPLATEVVVVQSQGMGRWLRLELAQRLGIWANGRFPFPEQFALEIFAALLPGVPERPRFSRDVLTWLLMELLPGVPEVASYLRDDDPRRLHQLAGKLAALFELYPIHRPELVLEWQSGRDRQWQARLWREAVARLGETHGAVLLQKLQQPSTSAAIAGRRGSRGCPPQMEMSFDVPAPTDDDRKPLPGRVCVFGVSALPRFHLDLLAWLGERSEVHLFRLEPCQEFWSDIRTRKQQERALARLGRGAAEAAAFHFETGNRLLASLGQAGRSFQELLLDSGDWQGEDQFAAPGTDTLLHALQHDILHLRDRGADLETPALPIARDDDSLRIHSCHSPMREVEVLQDHLLDWFQRDPTLKPRDILVMTTDIETYAPAIQAVFECPESEAQRIPFSLADRAARRESRVVDTFLRLLALPDTRLTAPEILAPLETPAVLARFGLAEGDLELIRRWVRETNIRWGRDAAHKTALGLPAFPENTWRQGLDRLLLGQALPGDGSQLLNGLLPYSEIEGEAAETLGRFCEYTTALFQAVDAMAQARPLPEWHEFLTDLLDRFFLEDEDSADELGVTRAALAELRRNAALASFTRAVPLSVLQETLAAALEEERYSSGFLTGGVTFCALKPMRSIPFRVICVLGLNDGVFPRSDTRLAFDLMAEKPRPGDRSARAEDRYLFLETLLSARDRLHLSYVGQSLQDNSVIPPSVVISELLDTVRQGFVLADDAAPDALEQRVVVRQRLHAFSPAYFDGTDARLFSYSRQNLTASRVAAAERHTPRPFMAQPLPEPEAVFRLVEVDGLTSFFQNPAKFLLTQRLGLRLPREQGALEDREPFEIGGLEQFRLQQELVAAQLAVPASGEDRLAVLRAAGRLPPGDSGAVWFAEQRELAASLARKAREHAGSTPMSRRELDFKIGEFQVRGIVPGVCGEQLLAWRPVENVGAKDLLALWIALLAVNAAGQAEAPLARGVVLGRKKDAELTAPADARKELEKLLQFYWAGLRQPLPFFPRSSLAFTRAAQKDGKDPIEAARGEWSHDSDFGPAGEEDDEWFQQCFGHGEPFDARFEQVALAVFEPLLACLKK